MKKVAFILLFGSAPLWIGVLMMVLGRNHNGVLEVGPWLLIFIAVPACVVATVMAALAVVAHDVTNGSAQHKLAMGALALLVQGALVGAWLWQSWLGKEQDIEALRRSGEEWVKSRPEVQRAAGGGSFRASITSWSGDPYTGFDAWVTNGADIHFDVIVEILQPRGSGFRLKCLTRLEEGQRTSTAVCRDDDSRGNGRYATP